MAGIVLTTDLSNESTRAFAPTLALANKLALPIHLVAVLEDLPFEVVTGGGFVATYPDREGVRAAWLKRLDELVKWFPAGTQVGSCLLQGHQVARCIVEHAHEQKADFIAMATHGRSGLRRMLLGSVAEEVIRCAHVPVIVFPPAAA